MNSREGPAVAASGLRDEALRRAFVSGAASKVVAIICSLISVGAATHYLGAEGYGVLAIVVGLSGVLGFLDLGIGNALVTELATAFAKRNVLAARRAVSNGFLVLVLAGGLLGAAGVATVINLPTSAFFDSGSVESSEVRAAAITFFVIMSVSLAFSMGPRMAVALQRGALTSLFTAGAAVVTLAVVVLGVALELTIPYFVLAFAGVPALSNLILTVLLFARHPRFLRLHWGLINLRALGTMALSGLPYLSLVLAGAIAFQTDLIVIGYVLGSAAAAVAGILNRALTSLNLLFSAGLQQMWASVAHARASGDHSWVRQNFWRTLRRTTALFATAATALVILGPWLIPLWAGPTIAPTWDIILAFAIWNTYSFVMLQFSFLLNGAGIVWAQAVPALIMAAVNIPLSIFLTGAIGIAGPAYASLIAHSLTVGWLVIVLAIRLLRPN